MKKLTRKYQVQGSINGIKINEVATFHYKFTQYGKPKTYKKIGIIQKDHSNYESGLITIFKARDNTLRFEIYHDGNFYPYYGIIEFQNFKLN